MPFFFCWGCSRPCILYSCDDCDDAPKTCPWGLTSVNWIEYREVE
ncbi:hypothetical protein [Archaeoglobus sp.]